MKVKSRMALIVVFSVFMSCNSSDKENSETITTQDTNSVPDPLVLWETVWEDNFDDTCINFDDWTIWEGGAYNNELQLYQSSNIRVEDGLLYIDSKREMVTGPTTNTDPNTKSFDFTSGRIESKVFYSPSDPDFNGGVKFSVRVKIGTGEGIWPAFWSHGDPWPTQGEIDVFEIRGGEPEIFLSNYFYGTTPGVNEVTGGVKAYTHSESLGNNFHIYEVEWTKDNFKVYFDGTLVSTYTSTPTNFMEEFYNKMQKVVINGAVGGDFFNNLDPSTIPDNVTHTIDWIRVSKIKT